eukprot:5217155-Amphidinium_carterae.1
MIEAHRVVEWVKKVAPEKHDALMEVTCGQDLLRSKGVASRCFVYSSLIAASRQGGSRQESQKCASS